MNNTYTQYTDPEVSRLKFENELENFQVVAGYNRKRGIVLMDYKFPDIWVSFTATQLAPPPILFCVKINFTNYDNEPPSVMFVDPFSFEPLKMENVNIQLFRKIGVKEDGSPDVNTMLVARDDQIPFFCLPGIREYHSHPQHTGDSWYLHRKRGEGTLGYIIEKLYEYSIPYLSTYKVTLTLLIGKRPIVLQPDVQQLQIGIDINKLPI